MALAASPLERWVEVSAGLGSGCRTGRWGRGAGCVFSAVGAGGKGPGWGRGGAWVVEGVRSGGVLPGPWQALDLAAVMQFSSIWW